ncbi:hypothetical protein [Bacillus paranthracis]|uniref:Uncharacterized protein n=1 Tax=Bacillus paranthracis TaxID=2026186 RepID=A0AAJ1NFZ2_9BACI|nr:hypothetical protein [Bacillus paranthracis]MDG0949865.1 hypothetical protein [Bacillus paranthracis]MDG0955712.1 hypothetical protein [Bacillus paranthracis]
MKKKREPVGPNEHDFVDVSTKYISATSPFASQSIDILAATIPITAPQLAQLINIFNRINIGTTAFFIEPTSVNGVFLRNALQQLDTFLTGFYPDFYPEVAYSQYLSRIPRVLIDELFAVPIQSDARIFGKLGTTLQQLYAALGAFVI